MEEFCLSVLDAPEDELFSSVEADALTMRGEADFVASLREGRD